MISVSDLQQLAQTRLQDAETLFAASRFDAAFYLCGYVLEFALKARICQTLNWPDFPSTRKEFEELQSFKTHSLPVLLKLSGQELRIKTGYSTEWTKASTWNSEIRYNLTGSTTQSDAATMIQFTKVLVGAL